MGTLVELPYARSVFDDAGWAETELNIRRIFVEAGISRDAVNWIIADFRPRFLRMKTSFSFSIKSTVEDLEHNEAQAAIWNVQLNSFVDRARLEILLLEADICRAMFGPVPPDKNHPHPAVVLTKLADQYRAASAA